MEPGKNIIIIGGGIAGLSLALFLKKAGIGAEVFEAASNTSGVLGAGLNIAPNGMFVLKQLGLESKVIEKGSIVADGIFKNAKGSRLAKIRFTNFKKYPSPAVNIKRKTLYEILFAKLKEENIPLHFNKKITALREAGTSVIARFEDSTEIPGFILIGADGINSTVRSLLFSSAIQPEFTGITGRGGFTAKRNLPASTERDFQNLHFIYGKNGFFGFSGVNKNEIMWWTNMMSARPFSKAALKNFDLNEERNALLKQYASYSYPVSEIIRHSESFIRVNVFDVSFLPAWHKGRVILIGDAAHAVSPNSGQGASMALEDAMLLARMLRDNDDDVETAFSKFVKERKPRVEKIVMEGRKRGDDKIVVNSFRQFIREIMIRIFVNLFSEKGNEWLFKYKIEW